MSYILLVFIIIIINGPKNKGSVMNDVLASHTCKRAVGF